MKTEEKESEISGKSPVITEENKKELLESIKAIKAGDVLVLSGSVPKTMGNEIYRDMISKVPEGVKVILDTRDEPFKYSLEAGVYLTKPNKNELAKIANHLLLSLRLLKTSPLNKSSSNIGAKITD